MLPQAAGPRAGPRVGRYLITGRIGRGGMGMVYRGLDEALEREVAVKTLVVEGTRDAESRRRFEVEARAAARLQHPNIVTVYELGEDRGLPFIAMELLAGADLEELLRSGEELTLAEKLEILVQVCRGLAYAHEHGIVHRDIKPSNVRVLDDGTAKIVDFGIAKLGGLHLTRTGMMVGTVSYMSPEQVRGRPLDGRSDVFSVGVILYELLCGERPFRAGTTTQVLYKIVHEEPPRLDLSTHGALGGRLGAVLGRALAKDPETRYPAAAALADDLAALLEEARKVAGAVAPGAAEALAAGRRIAREGRLEEAEEGLRGLVAEHPAYLEARRALRALRRERKARSGPASAGPDSYPELEATRESAPTRREAGTELAPTATLSSAATPGTAAGPRRRRLGWWLAAVVAAVATTAALVFRGMAPPAPVEARLPVRSQPVGASVLVDGRDSGVVTNGELVLKPPLPARVVLTFRKEGHLDETREVSLPPAAGEPVSVTLQTAVRVVPVRTDPPGARVALDGQPVAGRTPLDLALDPTVDHRIVVSLEGHAEREVSVEAGEEPEALDVALDRLVPAGSVRVSASYPVDVFWEGRPLARGESAVRVPVPGGRQVLRLRSSAMLLDREVVVEVPPGGETSLVAPPLGRLNVRAVPDNCEVLVNGAFLDYPPILDRPVAAGHYTVTFRWPDGSTTERPVEVRGDSPAFVVGRKE